MYLTRVHVGAFGSLRNRDFELAPGLNLIFGRNESGKSTLCAFIGFLLYGADRAVRSRCIPWDGDALSGWAELTSDGEQYRIEREWRMPARDTVRIVRLSDGVAVFSGECPGEVFLHIPAPLFYRIAYVSQAQGNTVDGVRTSQAVENLLFSGDAALGFRRAQKKLEDFRIALWHKNKKGGSVFRLSEELAQNEAILARSAQERAALDAEQEALETRKQQCEQEAAELTRLQDMLVYTRAYHACEAFDRLRALQAEAQTLTDRRASLLARATQNGFFPDEAYISRTEQLSRRCSDDREQVARAELALAEARAAAEAQTDARAAQRTAEMGGVEALVARLTEMKRWQKRFRVLGFLVLWLIPLGVGFLIHAHRIGRAYRALLSELGLMPGWDIPAVLRERQACMDADAARREAISAAEARLQALREAQAQDDAALAACLAEWGQVDADTALRDARSALESMRETEQSLLTCRKTAEALQASLTGMHEGVERRICEGLAQKGYRPLNSDDMPDSARLQERAARAEQEREAVYRAELSLSARRAALPDPSALRERGESLRAEYARQMRRYRALELAQDRLEAASQTLRADLAPRLSARAGAIMGELTDGKYTRVGVRNDFSMEYTRTDEDGCLGTRDVSHLSAGAEDLAYISLRLALSDVLELSHGGLFLFDESFSRLDDERLSRVLRLMSRTAQRDGRQILLLSSCQRDAALLAGEHFHLVSMESDP